MSEQNKAVVRRLMEEVWTKGNVALIDELIASDFVNHDPVNPDIRGPEGYRQLVAKYRTAFPDAQLEIEGGLIAEGDTVAARYTWRGTHRNALDDIPATGKFVSGTGILINSVSGGKIRESWVNWDTLGMLQQLGVVSLTGQAKAAT